MKRIPFYSFLAATAISLIGNYLTMIAVPWFVLELTGSAARTGLAGFFTALPAVIATFFGGTIVDRVGHRRMSILSDIGSGVTVAMIPLFYSSIGLPFWLLLTLVFFSALLDAPGSTARASLLPDLAQAAGVDLERANAIQQSLRRGAALLGPALSGVLIAWVGANNVLWLDAATFAVSALIFFWAIPSGRVLGAEGTSYLEDLKAGLQFVRGNRLILTLMITVAMTNFLDAPLFSVVIPVYARQFYGQATNLGLMISTFGGGALAGALLYGMFGRKFPRRALFISAFFLVGIPFWVLALTPSFPIVLALLFISGLAAGPINPLIMTAAQERVPPGMRGRVFGLMTSGAYIATPLGMLLIGYLVEYFSVTTTILFIAGGYFLVTTAQFFNQVLSELEGNKESHLIGGGSHEKTGS